MIWDRRERDGNPLQTEGGNRNLVMAVMVPAGHGRHRPWHMKAEATLQTPTTATNVGPDTKDLADTIRRLETLDTSTMASIRPGHRRSHRGINLLPTDDNERVHEWPVSLR